MRTSLACGGTEEVLDVDVERRTALPSLHNRTPQRASGCHGDPRARVLIADDHLLVAEGVRNLVEPEFNVVGVVLNGKQLLDSIEELQPDVIILEISMSGLGGLEVGELVKLQGQRIKLIYLTTFAKAEVAAEAFRRGASGYVLKQGEAAELKMAMRGAILGKSYISSQVDRNEVEYRLRKVKGYKHPKEFTERQREILHLLARGLSTKEIADLLSIKYGTVTFHKYRIMELLGIKTRAALLQFALSHSHAPADGPGESLASSPAISGSQWSAWPFVQTSQPVRLSSNNPGRDVTRTQSGTLLRPCTI